MDVNNMCTVQTSHDRELSATNEKASRESFSEGDRVLFRMRDRVEVERK